MKTINDSTGKQIEVYTKEELDAQRNEAVESFKRDNPDKTEDMEKREKELKEAKSELEKAHEELKKISGKDFNFRTLEKAKNEAEAKVSELQKSLDDKISIAKKEILEGVYKDHYNEVLRSLSHDDAEIKKKIEFEYARLKDSAATKEEISIKLRDAWVLATKPDEHDVFTTSVISSGGVSRMKPYGEKKFTQDEKEVGKKLGLSEKDFEKYGGN